MMWNLTVPIDDDTAIHVIYEAKEPVTLASLSPVELMDIEDWAYRAQWVAEALGTQFLNVSVRNAVDQNEIEVDD